MPEFLQSLQGLLIASKSRWEPAIRREHELARLAAASGHPVAFVESPSDVRGLVRRKRPAPLGFQAGGPAGGAVEVVRRSVLLPAHLHHFLEPLEGRSMRRAVAAFLDDTPTLVATLPWHWPALRGARGCRKVLDVADDWSVLLPRSRRRIIELYKCAAEEADAITVVSDALRVLFPGRQVQTIRNGLDSRLLVSPQSRTPDTARLVYVGTLSERFDSTLVGAVLDGLPGWRVDLYGSCAYARRGNRPGADLDKLLSRGDGRATWHGPIPRSRLPAVLDRAEVLLIPNRSTTKGQDSMKMYEYAARGRPVVATEAAIDGMSERPPRLAAASTARELAQLILSAREEPEAWGEERITWARKQTWERRWPRWSAVLFNPGGVSAASR